ncbi:MAG: TlyA family RNA methyltransferase [Proteobacteria bacterium]|nr:TlyA family RNA methyltransferase [Pseudomonadota bacterium]
MNSFHARNSKPRAPRLADTPAARSGLRADAWLVAHGLAPSRTVARRMIEAGRVVWRNTGRPETVDKASQLLPETAAVTVAPDEEDRYVSRGGLKLAGALATSGIRMHGLACLDVGQSTGGFSDCLLQAGAARVVGVEVGHDQLHPRLHGRNDLACLEGTNARHLTIADLHGHFPPGGFDLIVADLSFISLALVLPALPPLLAVSGQMLLLVKPQFEVGPGNLAKGGIVRDTSLYPEVEQRIRTAAALSGLRVRGWIESPITGGDGNREFFLWTEHEHT